MIQKRKVLVITGTRAEYGLLKFLIKDISKDKSIDLKLIATGAHLSNSYGLTYKEIVADGVNINSKIDTLLGSDTEVGISKSIGLGISLFADEYKKNPPNLIIVLGDRYEIFAAVIAALITRIPVAHIHGGELTKGAVDEAMRHSITKMSHLHFVANTEYKNRVIQLGEHPRNVYNIGGMGVDCIERTKLIDKKTLESDLGLKFLKKSLLVTFHSVTLDHDTALMHSKELLKALSEMEDTTLIFTYANADTDGSKIISALKIFVKENKNAFLFDSLGQTRYLSCLKQVDGVIGNSSSGLTEAPSFRIGTINIGDRQGGRLKAKSVIDCDPKYLDIKKAIVKLYSSSFQRILKSVKNPYGQPGAAKKLLEIIKKVNLEGLIKKSFFDL